MDADPDPAAVPDVLQELILFRLQFLPGHVDLDRAEDDLEGTESCTLEFVRRHTFLPDQFVQWDTFPGGNSCGWIHSIRAAGYIFRLEFVQRRTFHSCGWIHF